jgi:hypothetical protein
MNIVDVTVNRNFPGNERMLPNTPHVIHHAGWLVRDRILFYESSCTRALAVLWIGPNLSAAVRVMDYKPLTSSKQLMRDHQRADGAAQQFYASQCESSLVFL